MVSDEEIAAGNGLRLAAAAGAISAATATVAVAAVAAVAIAVAVAIAIATAAATTAVAAAVPAATARRDEETRAGGRHSDQRSFEFHTADIDKRYCCQQSAEGAVVTSRLAAESSLIQLAVQGPSLGA